VYPRLKHAGAGVGLSLFPTKEAACREAAILELSQETQSKKASIYWNSIGNSAMPFPAKIVFILLHINCTQPFSV